MHVRFPHVNTIGVKGWFWNLVNIIDKIKRDCFVGVYSGSNIPELNSLEVKLVDRWFIISVSIYVISQL